MKSISIVPQDLFIINDTEANIAYGVNEEDINYEKLYDSLRISQLNSFAISIERNRYSTIRKWKEY